MARLIHEFFELSYAQYLTIPRSVLQSMPDEWQGRFVQCLDELDEMIDWRPTAEQHRVQYQVRLMTVEERYDEEDETWRDAWGHELNDPLMDYQRGRRRVPLKGEH